MNASFNNYVVCLTTLPLTQTWITAYDKMTEYNELERMSIQEMAAQFKDVSQHLP